MKAYDFDANDIIDFAQERETDIEIAEAIFLIANDIDDAERIWNRPSHIEWLRIWHRVTDHGIIDGNNFCWGVCRLGNQYPKSFFCSDIEDLSS